MSAGNCDQVLVCAKRGKSIECFACGADAARREHAPCAALIAELKLENERLGMEVCVCARARARIVCVCGRVCVCVDGHACMAVLPSTCSPGEFPRS